MPNKNNTNRGLTAVRLYSPTIHCVQTQSPVAIDIISFSLKFFNLKKAAARKFVRFIKTKKRRCYLPCFKREFDKRRGNNGVLAGSNTITCGYGKNITYFIYFATDREVFILILFLQTDIITYESMLSYIFEVRSDSQ